jgi:hypothetical protein
MIICLACVVNELDSHVESDMEDQIVGGLGRKIGNSTRGLGGTKSKQLKKGQRSTTMLRVCT